MLRRGGISLHPQIHPVGVQLVVGIMDIPIGVSFPLLGPPSQLLSFPLTSRLYMDKPKALPAHCNMLVVMISSFPHYTLQWGVPHSNPLPLSGIPILVAQCPPCSSPGPATGFSPSHCSFPSCHQVSHHSNPSLCSPLTTPPEQKTG